MGGAAPLDAFVREVLFVGKRFYTNRDALNEKYGRIHQLPWHWADAGIQTTLWLVDYHRRESICQHDGALQVVSTPVRNGAVMPQWLAWRTAPGRPRPTVVASGDCYIGLVAYRLARRLRARFVFDIYDKYDEFGGYLELPGFDLFRFLMRRADVCLFSSRHLLEASSAFTRASLLVPNGVDFTSFRPLDQAASRRALGLPADAKLVGYFGAMEPGRGVADLVAAIGLLRAEGLGVDLLLGGKLHPGVDPRQPGVRYLGNVAYERMPEVLASCDLLAVPYRRSAIMDAVASNKVAEAIACRRPIVATRTPNLLANFPEQARKLEDLLAEPGDPASIARAIRGQLAAQVLVDMPRGMSWSEISSATARALFSGQRPVIGVGEHQGT